MTLAELIALAGAIDGTAEVILKIIFMLQAQGHPSTAPIPQDHLLEVLAKVDGIGEMVNTCEWDADHTNNGN